MIAILEKVTWGLAGVVTVVIAILFLAMGAPSTRPYIATRSEEVSKQDWDSLIAPEIRAEVQAREKEARGDKPGRNRRTVKFRKVNVDMYDRIANPNDAFREAMKASSEVNADNRLVIQEFGDKNLFEKLGFMENDEIEKINGVTIDFENITRREALKFYQRFKEDFDAGKPISVDLLRNGKPHTLWFGPDFHRP